MHRNGVGEFVLKDVLDSFEVRIVANSSVKSSWLNYEGGEMSEFLYF
jgi:hypothetical protein